MPTDIAARLAGQVDGGALEILGVSPPARGDPGRDARQPLLVLEQGLVHVRGDVPRRDGVDGDAAAGPLVGKRLGQLRDGALARRVGRHRQPALEREQAGIVDDGAPAARDGVRLQREHVRAHVARQRKHRPEVHLHHLVEVRVGEHLALVPALDPAAVYQDADLVPVGEHLGRQRRHALGGREVRHVDLGLAAQGEDGVPGCGGGLVSLLFC